MSGNRGEAMSAVPATASGQEKSGAVERLINNVERSVKGKRSVIELSVVALLARGHVLFEDVPGVGKTTLSLALSRSVGLGFKRIQCTADLMPSDVIGVAIYDQRTSQFDFKPGPLFSNVVLVDEINRATPKTQSALLEAMGEGTVSVERQVHELPKPFWVVATQNPLDVQGTYPLPENQLDRFIMRLSVGYPDAAAEASIILRGGAPERPDQLKSVVTMEELLKLMSQVDTIKVDTSLADYAVQLCQKTRNSTHFQIGASTRAAVAWMHAARSLALVRGRGYVTPNDLIDLWLPVMGHRVVTTNSGQMAERSHTDMALRDVLKQVKVPD